MGKTYILYDKAIAFSQRIMKMEQYLKKNNLVPPDITRQVLRSGTSIAANISESINAESKLDFIHKLKIALKEADETKLWLTNINASYEIHKTAMESILSDVQEIIYILIASINTAKSNIKKEGESVLMQK